MDKTIQTFSSFGEMKAAEYRYWQSRPAHERMEAVCELTLSLYEIKEPCADVSRLQRVVRVLPRSQR